MPGRLCDGPARTVAIGQVARHHHPLVLARVDPRPRPVLLEHLGAVLQDPVNESAPGRQGGEHRRPDPVDLDRVSGHRHQPGGGGRHERPGAARAGRRLHRPAVLPLLGLPQQGKPLGVGSRITQLEVGFHLEGVEGVR